MSNIFLYMFIIVLSLYSYCNPLIPIIENNSSIVLCPNFKLFRLLIYSVTSFSIFSGLRLLLLVSSWLSKLYCIILVASYSLSCYYLYVVLKPLRSICQYFFLIVPIFFSFSTTMFHKMVSGSLYYLSQFFTNSHHFLFFRNSFLIIYLSLLKIYKYVLMILD